MPDAPKTKLKLKGLSLRTKITLGLLLVVVIFAGQSAFNIFTQQRQQRDEALANQETVARLVLGAITPELGHNDIHSETIHTFLNNFLSAAVTLNKKNKDLAYVVVVDNERKVIGGKVKTDVTIFPGNKRLEAEGEAATEIARLDGKLGGNMYIMSATISQDGKAVGRILVGTSHARMNKQVREVLLINIGVFAGAVVLMILYAGIALSRMVVNPILTIVDSMRSVEEGKLDATVDFNRGDEIGTLATTYNYMLHGLQEREHLKDAFSRYVSKQVYEKFRAGAINLKGEMRNATVLFSDIRSFTSLSEQLTPTEVVAMLNEYFTEMVEIVFKHDGFLNKFIGDAIMAIYNVPLDQSEPELRAVKTGLEMLVSLERLNDRRTARGQYPLRIGIGINTGAVVAGNLGHEKRLEYTVIGDAVNLAQRLEAQTKVAGAPLLVSEATFRPCAQHLVATALPPVKVKGKTEPVITYAVYGLADGSVTLAQPQQNAAGNVAAAQILEHG
jgi:class 3 adenylate cyclase